MVEMLFYIRFRAQLRRTRPELIASLEDVVTQAAVAAGGTTEARRKVLAASFDEDRIGFWLDIVIFLERVHKALEKVSGELYGYALALGRHSSEAAILKLCRCTRNPSGKQGQRLGTGIWCSEDVSKALNYYMTFGSAQTLYASPPQTANDDLVDNEEYREFLEWRDYEAERSSPPRTRLPRKVLETIPPLCVRFGAAGNALVCFADAYTPSIRSFIATAASPEIIEELDTIHALLFRERLRQELSPYMTNQVRHFIRSLLQAYIAVVKTQAPRGALVLEALHLAEAAAAKIFRDAYFSLEREKTRLVLIAANSTERSLTSWSNALNQNIAQDEFLLPEKNYAQRNNFPQEVLEVAYNIFLLGQYFPGYLLPELFEEQGLNREMYFRAAALLTQGVLTGSGIYADGVSAGSASTVSGMPVFAFYGEKTLPPGKEKIHRAVRKIILSWVGEGRLRPCFNLLDILFELGERAGDDLVLRAVKSEVFNGTPEEIEKSIKKGMFDFLVGQANVPVLSYIYKTLKALVSGERDEIQQAFQEPVPPMTLEGNNPCSQAYEAQIQVNLAAFYISVRNREAASEAVRKAMLLNQGMRKNAVPAHRLFALVHLSRQRINDALEYISFALDQAENMEQDEELAITCYFASSINFLHGNLSKAQRLAAKAEKAALILGQADWAMWARFLLGKITFEVGSYADALHVFQSLDNTLDSESAVLSAKMSGTVQAWIHRAKVFLASTNVLSASAHNAGVSGFDGRLFQIEAAYFAADYERAKDLADRFLSSSSREASELHSVELHSAESHSAKHFIFTEQPDFMSGFAQCENIFLSGKALGARMAWIYRSMSQCALRPSKEAKAEILGGMQRFMRDELLPDTDPNDPFYFHAWYCMLRDTEAAQVDMNTIVSMAYKRLQRRASRIDDMKTMQTFMKQSCWNNTLRMAAKDHNLI